MQAVARQLQQFDCNNGSGVFSVWPVPGSYREENWGDPVSCKLACQEKTRKAV
jgi:hypothetical protein